MDWYVKHNPTKVDDIIIPQKIKNLVLGAYENGNQKHFIFYSKTPGVGKTSFANLIANHFKKAFRELEGGSDDTTKSGIVNNLDKFSRQMTKNGKLCVINEGHRMYTRKNSVSGQDAVVKIMNDVATDGRQMSIIITTNDMTHMDEYLESRATYVDFDYSSEEEINEVVPQFKSRLINIAEEENVEYSEEVIDKLIDDNYPSMRDMVKELQNIYLANGNALEYSKTNSSNNMNILKLLKDEDFNEAYKELVINKLVNDNIFTYIHRLIENKPKSNLIKKIHRLSWKHSTYDGTDPELNIYVFLLNLSELLQVKAK